MTGTKVSETIRDCLGELASEPDPWVPVKLSPTGGLMVGFPGPQGRVRWLEVAIEKAVVTLASVMYHQRDERVPRLGTKGSPTQAQHRHDAWHKKGQWVSGCRWCDEGRGRAEAEAAARRAKADRARVRKPKLKPFERPPARDSAEAGF